MRTNLVQTCKTSANRINLNRTAMRVALIGLFISLGIGNAWADSYYYAKLTLSTSGPTGAGSVYASTSTTQGSSASVGPTKSAANTKSVVFYGVAKPNAGYYFDKWTNTQNCSFDDATKASNVKITVSTSQTSESSAVEGKAVATFGTVTVSAAPSDVNINATDPSATYPDVGGVVVGFTTSKSNGNGDFTTGGSGDSRWTISAWPTHASATSTTFNYKFVGNGSYGTTDRTFTKTVTLKGLNDATVKTCTLTAKYPNPKVVSADESDEYTKIFTTFKATDATQTAVEKTAVFDVAYADDGNNFTAAFSSVTGGGAWNVTEITVDQNNQKATVTYTFNGNKAEGTHTALLTLTAKDCNGWNDGEVAGSASASVTITAENEQESDYDVEVYNISGTKISDNTTTWTQGLALANANEGSTIKLMRNVSDVNTLQTITKSVTIDLNGKTISGTGATQKISSTTYYTLFYCGTAGKTITIKDSKTGGKIKAIRDLNARLHTFVSYNGNHIVLQSGTVESENTGIYSSSKKSVGTCPIYVKTKSTFTQDGGVVSSIAGRNAYGVIGEAAATTHSTITLNQGEVNVKTPVGAYGVVSTGEINVHEGAVIKVRTEAVNGVAGGATAYGIQANVSAAATDASSYYSTLNMDGGLIDVFTTTTSCYGIFIQGATSAATETATDGTHSNKATPHCNITGGRIKVYSTSTTAQGIQVIGDTNTKTGEHVVAQIKNMKIEVEGEHPSGSTNAANIYGIYVHAACDTARMGLRQGDVELTNCNVSATARKGQTAVAVYVHAAQFSKLGAPYKEEEIATAGKVTINSGTYTAETTTGRYAYAVQSAARVKSILGKAEAYPTIIIHGGTFTTTSGTTDSYAVNAGGNTTIDGGTFNATSGSSSAIGIIHRAGKLIVSGVRITSHATTSSAYGIYLTGTIHDYTGYAYASDAEINNVDATVTTGSGNAAYGVWLNAIMKSETQARYDTYMAGTANAVTKSYYDRVWSLGGHAIAPKITINGGTFKVTSAGTTAYGAWSKKTAHPAELDVEASPEMTIRNATFDVTSTTSTAGGVRGGGPVTVDNCDITVKATTETAYGVLMDDKTGVVSNSTIDVTTPTKAYGLYAYSPICTKVEDCWGALGIEFVGKIEANDNIVTAKATGGNTSYAVYVSAAKAATASGPLAGDHAIAGEAIINSGKYTATATGTTAYAIGLVAQQNQNGVIAQPECVVNNGKFWGKATGGTDGCIDTNGKTGHAVLNGGFYNVNTNLANYVALDKSLFALSNTYHPEYDEGYRYIIAAENPGGEVCKVYQGNTERGSYRSLVEALQYVNANSGTALTIVMTDHHTLPAGDYLLPVNATLLVPYKTGTGAGATAALGTSVSRTNTAGTLSPFKKLTFASGANMTVQGKIETSAQMLCANGGQPVSGCVTGPYGQLHLQEGAHIDLESTATLYAWGYITGDGVITAKKNSKVYEDFVLGYWRGGSASYDMMGNSAKAFFVTDYAYQNIECPVVYKAGAMAYGYSGVYAASGIRTCDNVGIVGTADALFKMDASAEAENAWVKKEYNASEDRVYWTMKSGASISNMKIKLSNIPLIGTIDMDSKDYNLPITSNFTITMLDGRVNVTNDVLFMPGSQLFINKEATAVVASGKKLYFYDNEDWQKTGGKWYYPITYSPSWGNSNPRVLLYSQTATTNPLPDAEVFIHGTMEVNGQLFTTGQRDASLAGRSANIHSTNEDAGTIVYTVAATADGTVGQCISTGPAYVTAQTTSARLKNGNGAYTVTSGTGAGYVYEYENDQWVCRVKDGCMTKSIDGSGEHYFAKPSDVVEVAANATDEAYHGVADPTRYFIYAENNTKNNAASATATSCVWWECEHLGIIDGVNYYKATNENFDNYGTYYYFDEGCGFWKPKCVTVTWTNWDGTILKYANNSNTVDQVPYNTSPVYLGQNPTRTNTATEKYDWVGWRDANGNIYTKNDVLPLATADVTYTAYYNTSKFQYTITFKNEDDNKVIWSGLIEAGNPAVCPVTPTQASTVSTDYTFTNWSGYAAGANLPEVTGSTTYIAQYSESPRKYHVTFYNYDAATVLYEADVDYNARPVYNGVGVTPFRSNTSAYSYEWTGWQQGTNTYDTDDDLAIVTGDVYYVATFSQTDLKYQVLFKRQDGSIIDAPFFNFEETPASFPANPTLASTVSTDYTFDHWDPATLQPVTVDGMIYTAYFSESTRQYTAHFVNYNGTSLNVDQTIDYNTVPAYTGATPFHPNDSRNSYEFSGWAWAAGEGWEAGSIGVGEAFHAIKGDITFTAQFTPVLLQFNVIYQREDGTIILQDKKKWGENTAFPTSGLDYEDEIYTYTFDHWNPATVVNPVTTDATYTAYYNQSIKTYSITAVGISPAGYGSVSPASLSGIPGGSTVTVNGNKLTVNGSDITATPADATAQYTYTFDHWNNVPATVTGNISDIEAVFTRTVNQYDVTFNMKGHGAAISSQTKDYGSKVDQPADPSEAGYTFVGWYKEDACTNAWNFASDEVTDATTLFAKWTVNSYTITFDGNGGSEVASITQNYGTEITPPANPTRTGYTFAGWDPAVPATMPVDGETCVAQWTINSYQVKFVDEDGTTNLGSYPQTLDYGTAVTAPEEPTKAADATNVYTFAGWSDGVSTYASADIPAVSGAVTYTATYNSAPTVASVTVGGATTYYATLQAAFDYAANKTTPTITMLQSVTDITTPLTYTNSSNTTVTFELNGKTVSGGVTSKTYLLYITGNNSGLFKIQDSAGDGKISNTMSKNAAHYCVYVYNCPTELRSGTIYMENKNTSSSVQAFGVNVRGSRKFEMKGGTIEVKSSKNAHAIYSSGTTNISAGTLIATETKNGYASGVHVINGKTTITGTPTFTISGTKYVNGVRVGGLKPALNSKKTAVTQYNGTADIQGGTYIVTASSNTAYGVLCYRDTLALSYADNATCPGNYAGAGKVTISGGEFTVSSTGATAYGICTQSAYTVTSAKAADGVTLLSSNTVTPKTTITGGKFNVSGSSSVGAVNTSATADNLLVQGGWYNINTNLSTKYTAPTKTCNYWVLPLTGEDPYKYEVAEAYMITFKNGDDVLQSTAVKKGTTPAYSGEEPTKATDAQYTYTFTGWSPALATVTEAATYTAQFSSTPRTYTVTLNTNGGTINAGNVTEYTYDTGATLPTNVTKDGYEFGGWFDNDGLTGDAVTTISTTATGDKEYWAKWVAAIADRELDIVDWTSNSITINVTNLKAVGGTNKNNWKIRVNGTDYTRTSPECSTQSRTLMIPGLTLTPNDNLLIQLKNDADVIESQHYYKIPQIYTANATLSGTDTDTDTESVVYVYGGKLTISGDAALAALYVCPGAEVEVTGGTLTVGKLVLRTKPWATAAISGSVDAANTYYTRIAPDGSSEYPTGQYYQFGLPYACAVSAVSLSDGTTPVYNSTWLLKSYNEERRAASGTSTNNWDALAADATIEAGRGYEMFSSYKYYREYYFPVTPTDNTLVSVTRHGDDKNNSGWNIVCSPLMNVYHNESDPVDGLKVSWLLADGSYDQAWTDVIWPAMPFSYQASANGDLDFSSGEFNQTVSSAPRRAAYKENIQTEWIHLDVKDGNGVGDHTSVFVHPDRFEATYETGIDVAKQSLTASRAILYSSHAYGDMAFAGVSDSLLEKGVALTVYSPKEQELTISMRNNNRLNRLAAVWLIDYEKGMTTDLLWNDYTFDAVSGTMSGRFIIQGAFFAPGVTTDLDNIQGDNIQNTKARKVIIDQKMYIQINGRLYDANGKLLKTEH